MIESGFVMARTPIAVTGISRSGATAPAAVAADTGDGNSVQNPGDTVLILTNSGGSDHTAQISITATVDGQPVAPRTITIPAGATRYAGPYDPLRYGRTLLVTADSTDVQIAALRLGDYLTTGPFTADGLTVIADLGYRGLTADGNVLLVDTVLTSSTIDGDVLVVTVV